MGRDHVLAQLDQQLQQSNHVAISTLTGMPGIGKSELALQYGWQEWPKKTYRGGICWLNVADSDPGLSILSFAQIHLGLTLPEEGELVERVRYVWQSWLKNEQDQTLIIFDDVRDYQQIKDYLPPQTDQRFNVIITTRRKELLAKSQTLHVNILQPEAALDLLRSYVTDGRIDDQLEQANLLCRDLGYLPLALELVARLLRRRTNWTVTKIREKLIKNGLADQSLVKDPKFDSEMTAERGVKAAFDLSWQELESEPNAQKLAMYLSLFALAPFPKPLIDGLFPEADEDEIEEWLTDSLVHLNLVKSLDDGWYELNTLIRHYLRDKLKDTPNINNLSKFSYCEMIVNIAKRFPSLPKLSDITFLKNIIDHIQVAANEFGECLDVENLLFLYAHLGKFYEVQGLYHEALTYRVKYHNLVENNFGIEHLFFATALSGLAGIKLFFAEYREAEKLYQQALEIRETELGAEHSDVIDILHDLALVYQCQEKYEDAEKKYVSIISIYENKQEKEHLEEKEYLDLATIFCNLGGLYEVKEEYEKSKFYLNKVLTLTENRKEISPSIRAVAYTNLASISNAQGESYDVEKFLNKSCSIFKNNLMNNHPAMGASFNNLAEFYSNQGRYIEADFLYQKSLFISEKKLGVANSITIRIRRNYANFLKKWAASLQKNSVGGLVSKSNC